MPNRVKVIVADDHPLIRMGICRLFEGKSDVEIVGEASDGREAIDLVLKYDADILILDMQMPKMDGIQTLHHLKKIGSRVRTLVVSAFDDIQYTTCVFELGAWGYYLKEEAPTQIVDAVRQASRGDGQGTRPKPSPKLVQKLINCK